MKYHLNRIDQLRLMIDKNVEVPEVNIPRLLKQEFSRSVLIDIPVSENVRQLQDFVKEFQEHYI